MASVLGSASGAMSPDCFEIRVQPDREKVYVEPVGELDLASVPELRETVYELTGVGIQQVVIDLRRLTFIDVVGLRLLLRLDADARRDGWRLFLIAGSASIQRIFALTATRERLPFIARGDSASLDDRARHCAE